MYVQALLCWSERRDAQSVSTTCQGTFRKIAMAKKGCRTPTVLLHLPSHLWFPPQKPNTYDNACNLQPRNLNFSEGEKVGVWRFSSAWLLNPRIRNLKGSFQTASEKDSPGTPLCCKKLLAELLSRKEVAQKIKCGRIIDAFKLQTWL